MAWKWYTEINGFDGGTTTTEFGGTLNYIHRTDLTDNPQDTVLYFAEIEQDTGDNQVYKLEAESNPGTDQITISIDDSDVGNGHEADEITLALTSGDLATNTAGASLDLGSELLSGVSEAVAVHIRVENAVTVTGNSTELSLSRNAAVQSEV